MRNMWESLTPKNKRIVVVAGVAGAFALLIGFLPSGEKSDRFIKKDTEVRAIFTDRDNGSMRYERIEGELDNVRTKNRDLTNKLDTMGRDLERMEAGQLGPEVVRELENLREKVEKVELENRDLRRKVRNANTKPDNEAADDPDKGDGEETKLVDDGLPIIDEPGVAVSQGPASQEPGESMWNEALEPYTPPLSEEDEKALENGELIAPAQASIRTIGGEVAEESSSDDDMHMYLPAGSILTGTLVSGMDAPTGQGARNEPFPALLRLKHDALLPNRYRADIRECFVIVGGYGDLSSERAYLRGETISCIRKDGKVVETLLESFTVGEDGKAGLRGRLVSKQGQLLAKAMAAGVMEGFSQVFNRTPVPTISLDAAEEQIYQQAFSEDAVQSGAVAGVGSALDRLSQEYIKQADAMYPVIEIDAGRQVDVVLIRGVKLALFQEE